MQSTEQVKEECFAKIDSMSSQIRRREKSNQLLFDSMGLNQTRLEKYAENKLQILEGKMRRMATKTTFLYGKLESRNKQISFLEDRLRTVTAMNTKLMDEDISSQMLVFKDTLDKKTRVLDGKVEEIDGKQALLIKELQGMKRKVGGIEFKTKRKLQSASKKSQLLDGKIRVDFFKR